MIRISPVEVYERAGNSVILVWKKTQKDGMTDAFYGCENVVKTFWFEVHSHLKESAFVIVKRDAKF